MKNNCERCVYYNKENKTCQSKKVTTCGTGKVTAMDRLFCSPREREWIR